MRRVGILSFFALSFAVFLSLGVNAQTACPADDVIMRLSAVTNAHGELYNVTNSNYGIKICYNQIFGTSYSGNIATLRDCIGTNKVVRLSATTNAHAEIPTNSNPAYPVDVCYGDLVCRSITAGNCNTAAGEEEIISLSGNTNAHLGIAGAYSTKICCSTGSSIPQGLSNPQWKSYNGAILPSTTVICPNSYAVMSVQASGISTADFTLYDDDGLVGDDQIGGIITQGVRNSQSNAILNFSLPSFLLDLQNELNNEGDNRLELYFEATSSGSNTVQSGQIIYTTDTNLCSPSRPTASIEAPIHRGIYFNNVQMTFVSSCSSSIGPVNYEWEISQSGQIYQSSESTFNLTFGADFGGPGQANVKLKCTDIRGNYARDESQMLIVASPYALAYINRPAFEEFVYSSPISRVPYFPLNVPFSATDSFVVNVSACTVNCLAGNCPVQTQNIPSGCPGPNITLTGLHLTPRYQNVSFDWRFWDSDWSDEWTTNDGYNSSGGVVVYNDLSNSLNDKHISVSINDRNSGATASFQRDFTLGRCLNNGNTFYSTSSEVLSTTAPNNACKGVDAINGTGDDCCPTGHECMRGSSAGSPYSCQPSSNTRTLCIDFDTPASCNGNTNPAIPRASYGRNPAACEFLECYWIATGSNANTCGVRARQYPYSPINGCSTGGNSCPLYDCAWTTTQTECINGQKTISYTSESTPGPGRGCAIGTPTSCQRDPVTVPCGSLNFELSFFGSIQFIISLISIALLYLMFNRGKINGKRK